MEEAKNPNYSKYEHARIIGARALQISAGAPFLVKLSEADLEKLKYNPIEIAKMEYAQGLIPIGIKVPMPKSRLREQREKAQPKPVLAELAKEGEAQE